VALRLPRSKEELDMALHAAASALAPAGRFLLYGAKDEGIASAAERLGLLFRDVMTVAVGGHCRVLGARVRDVLPGLRKDLEAWREVFPLEHEGFKGDWVYYPGVFARRRLDPGTRLLLDALPELTPRARVLDFACGSGIVGAAVRFRYPSVRLDLLDVDSVALEAAGENVPGGRLLLADGLPPPDGEGYDAIVSNPPLHIGKAETPDIVLRLIDRSPALLKPGGVLVLVAQRRLPLGEAFRGAFGSLTVRHEGEGFRVWEGRDPCWRPG
jgi:16S rRNA (guanine1207-N2)-methyltransferase